MVVGAFDHAILPLAAALFVPVRACNACTQCAVFQADGTVKGSTFDVRLAFISYMPYLILAYDGSFFSRQTQKSSLPSRTLSMTGITRCCLCRTAARPSLQLLHSAALLPPHAFIPYHRHFIFFPCSICLFVRHDLTWRARPQVGHGLKLAGYDFEVRPRLQQRFLRAFEPSLSDSSH
jgi:hypothetical protein